MLYPIWGFRNRLFLQLARTWQVDVVIHFAAVYNGFDINDSP